MNCASAFPTAIRGGVAVDRVGGQPEVAPSNKTRRRTIATIVAAVYQQNMTVLRSAFSAYPICFMTTAACSSKRE